MNLHYSGAVIALGSFAAIFAVAELIYARTRAGEATRTLTHVLGGVGAACLPLLVSLRLAVSVGVCMTVFLVWTKRQCLLRSVHAIDRTTVGAVVYPLGLTLSALCFWDAHPLTIFPGSALVLGFSDALAGLYGRTHGRFTYDVTGPKTMEGSAVFFVVTFLIIFTLSITATKMPGAAVGPACAGALVLTVIEGLIGRGWDNLVLPIASGVVLQAVL